jgi:hypothetical protein
LEAQEPFMTESIEEIKYKLKSSTNWWEGQENRRQLQGRCHCPWLDILWESEGCVLCV